ncbi:saccharopine dehydrogenase family protein [Salipaludibacillus sp. HK11]|uniref:saccharopine dehydrogenase family protein n=1 Tax=Salipaludibacillus sp. HK11 TaxID=3394320 RepID=UPI0039FB9D38
MESNRIIVIGGYGHVGQKICHHLSNIYPGSVYAAGRNKNKANKFSESTNGKVKPIYIDVTEEIKDSFFEEVRLIIVCIDQDNTTFASQCLAKGIDYIDISASYSYLSKVEGLEETAKIHGARALLSVGLDPGLTNLLVSWVNEQLDTVERMDIFLMLGMGDKHGKAAISWTIENAKTNFTRMTRGKQVLEKSFEDGEKVNFGNEIGWRNVYRFNFADQHVLQRTLDIPEVSTRLCLDSVLATETIHMLKKSGLLRILPLKASVGLLGKMTYGKPIFIAKVEGRGQKQGENVQIDTMIQGEEEATVTALVTGLVAESLCRKNYPSGIYHIEELFGWTSMYEQLNHLVKWKKGDK